MIGKRSRYAIAAEIRGGTNEKGYVTTKARVRRETGKRRG
jgi:hypothetical protein